MRFENMEFRDPISAFLADHSLCIPLGQVFSLTIMMSICLLIKKPKLGLLISYSFVYYWGFVFNESFFIDVSGNASTEFYVYCILGLFMLVVSLFGFLNEKKISQVGRGKRKGERRKLFVKVPETIS